MPSVVTNIARIVPGSNSLISANRANELIDAINALRSFVLTPNVNVGSFSFLKSQAILDLSKFDARLRAVEANNSSGLFSNNVTAQLPFGVFIPNANAAIVNVRIASVGGILPNGIATNIPLTTPNSNTTIYLNITIDNNATVTAASINTGALPTPNTYTKAYARIANVQVLNSNVYIIDQDLLFSQSFVACGRDKSDPNTTPGTYFLQVS